MRIVGTASVRKKMDRSMAVSESSYGVEVAQKAIIMHFDIARTEKEDAEGTATMSRVKKQSPKNKDE